MEAVEPPPDVLAAVNQRLKTSLLENIQERALKKEVKEQQKQIMQDGESKGQPFASSLCVLFSGLKTEYDADALRKSLMQVDNTPLDLQSIQLVSVAEEQQRRMRRKDPKMREQYPAANLQEVKEYAGKAFVVFKKMEYVENLKAKAAALARLDPSLRSPNKDEYLLPMTIAASNGCVSFREVRRMGYRMYHEDAHGLKMKAIKLQVGNRLEEDLLSVWFEAGVSDKPVEVEVSRIQRTIKMKFQYGTERQERYCVSVKFKSLSGSMLPFIDTNQGGKDTLCLMFTLQHPPHIYKKVAGDQPQGTALKGPVNPANDFFKWSWPGSRDDEGWERTVDFTKDLSALGTVYTYRLVLKTDSSVKKVLDELNRFRMTEWTPGQERSIKKLHLRVGRLLYRKEDHMNQYTAALEKFEDHFDVNWRLRCLLHKGKVFHEQLLTNDVVQLLLGHISQKRVANVVAALEELMSSSKPITNILETLENHPLLLAKEAPGPSTSRPSYCVQVARLVITPTRLCCSSGDCELSNRVLRKYKEVSDRFLRVSIADEAGDKLHLGEDVSRELRVRIYEFLRKGVSIGNRHYKFLAFSNSQVRENSCWMFAELDRKQAEALGLKRPKKYTCDRIRKWMGDFSREHVVAKYAARMGQCFSSSIHACQIGDALEVIPDIKSESYFDADGKRHEYIFSDGVGRISMEVGYEITRKLRALKLYSSPLQPCAFQIRSQGDKGMLVVWEDIPGPDGMVGIGRTIQVRDSMRKFESHHDDLEVVGWSRWMPGHLNQQVILLLEDRGVGSSNFLALQREYKQKLTGMLQNREAALSFLVDWGWDERASCLGVVKDLLVSGFDVDEPFIHECLQALTGYVVKDLRTKARIQVCQSAMLYGVMDELGILEYGEVYVCIQKPSDMEPQVITSDVVITKNPCLHPGDVRRLRTRDVPQFRRLNLTNVVVFPQKGKRPHPSECSGSDLDGDIYFCCWDERIVNFVRNAAPFHYSAPAVLKKPQVEMKDVVRFFYEMMSNDALGRVARAWMAFADREPRGPSSEKCLRLAAKHHQAVDFPKTGVTVELARDEIPYEYPHFMANKTKPSYTSDKTLGKLYDDACNINVRASSSSYGALRVDPKLVLVSLVDADVWESCMKIAEACKLEYENELIKLMNRYDIVSEAELVCGCMVKVAKHKKRRWASDMRDQVLQQVQALWVHFHNKFKAITSQRREGLSPQLYQLVMASAWYYSTYVNVNSGIRLLSFPWVVHHELCRLKCREDDRITRNIHGG